MSTQNITSLDGSSYEAIHSSISQNVFSYLKMFSMQCRKIIAVEDNIKRMNITNVINIYANIYIYIYIYYIYIYILHIYIIYIYIYIYIICDKSDSK